MIIGNWEIDLVNRKIIWLGQEERVILMDEIFASTPSRSFYDAILHLSERFFVQDADIFTLNIAVMFAIVRLEIEIPEGFDFTELVTAQLRIVRDEEEDLPFGQD